ncbi:M23 family metallopeptidase [Rudaea sp.]|uniref:M23 family metallopeptidase n=1 Tax=Rudaea sp. TaxID=2136325 RepID=UPI0037841EDB
MTMLFLVSQSHAADRELQLPEQLQQGQLVVGHAPKGAKIEFAGRRVLVGDDGVFVFGLGRDAPAAEKLHIRYSNGKASDIVLKVTRREYETERVNGLPQHTVTPNPELLKRIERERARVAETRHRNDAREDFEQGFLDPVENARVSGLWGRQRIDNGKPMAPHFGLDFAVPNGTPIHATAPGIVTLAEMGMVLNGGIVVLDHGHGVTTTTIHMSRIDVKPGQKVKQGDIVGLAGATGRATGPHVHWAANWFDVAVDPALLPKAGTITGQ